MAKTIRILLTACALAITATGLIHSQTVTECGDIAAFFLSLPGEWVGTVTQTTDGKPTETKYFRATTRQVNALNYETVFCYYRSENGEPVAAGTSSITTKIDPTGSATNSIAGKGDILVDGCTLKPESHALTEILKACPTGGLQGTATGCISVSGMPLDVGKNGKVQDYRSTWTMDGDVLKISQSFKISFSVLLFRRNHRIVANYTATRGADLAGVMKTALPATAHAE